MSTLSAIIGRSYRESQILDINVAPSIDQESEALEILRGIIRRYERQPVMTIWLGDFNYTKRQRGQVFKDFTSYANIYAVPQDVYMNVNVTQSYTVCLPNDPGDGARINIIDVGNSLSSFPLTLEGNGNLINGALTETLSVNGSATEYMYRREQANWRTVTLDPVASSNLPFDQMFDDMFVIELAMRLNPRYGDDMNELSVAMYQTMRAQFVGRYMAQNSSAAPDIIWDRAFNSDVGDIGRAY